MAVSISPALTLGTAKLACAITTVEKAAALRMVVECMSRNEYMLGPERYRIGEKERNRLRKRA